MAGMNGSHYGADSETWTLFADGLGLTEDLLPVVSNPKIPKSPNSRVAEMGKVPSMLNRMGQAVGIAGWTSQHTTAAQIEAWSRNPDLGICLQTRAVRALDIDLLDAAAVARVIEVVDAVVGPLPVRYRENSTKCLLAFRLPGAYAKRILRTEHGNIEFLATGQQFVAAGTHPSGARYEWRGGPPKVIPEVSAKEFEMVWQALAEVFGTESVAVRAAGKAAERRDAGDIDDAFVGWLEENGWVLGWGPDGEANIRCPFDAEHTVDSGESATRYYPAGLGGYALGHFKCLHAHCAGRSDQQFLDGMGLTVASEFTPVPAVAPAAAGRDGDGWPEPGPLPPLSRLGKSGAIAPTIENATKLIARPDLIRAKIGYDAFLDMMTIEKPGMSAWRAFEDDDYVDIAVAFERLGVLMPTETVKAVVKWQARENRFDSAIRWGESLRWDGTPRIEQFLVRYLGCDDTPYHRAVGRYLWTAFGGRCMEPGCQADMTVVLISRQGTGKTSLVEALAPAPEMFVEVSLEHRDVDLARALRGKLVAELSELRGLAGRESEAIRAWLTRKTEEWVPKYREYAVTYRRRFILIGTTNTSEFLADDEGERRWLPVCVGNTDRDAIRRDIDQLWAEGIARWWAAGVDWNGAETLARDVHADHKVGEPWAPIIAAWLDQGPMDDENTPRRMAPVLLTNVLISAIGMNVKEITRAHELRAGRALRQMGYTKRGWRVDGRVIKVWLSPDFAEKQGLLPLV